MTNTAITPSTGKVRRDIVGGKRGTGGDPRAPRVRRPDPGKLKMAPTAEALTTHAGLASFGRFLRQAGVDRELRQFEYLKSSPLVVYPMASQMRLLIDPHVSGESRVFGLEALAADPLFVRLAGGVVPSIDTVYRDLVRFDTPAVRMLEQMMARWGLGHAALRRLREAHLDIDTTVTPQFCEREGALLGPNPRYHGRPSHHPVVARLAETDTCVGALLRPGDRAFGDEDASTVARIVRRTRQALHPNATLYVRIDAAADCTAVLRAISREKALFVVKAQLTPDLKLAIGRATQWTTVDRDADGRPLTQVCEVDFTRKPWAEHALSVRVVAVRTKDQTAGKQVYLWPEMDYTVKAYLTNNAEPVEDVAARYDGRAGVEPLIAEWKRGWGIGETPCWSFLANHAALLLKLFAHNLLRRFARHVAPRLSAARWRAQWLRRALIHLPGQLVHSGRRWLLRVPARSLLASLRI